MSAGVHNNVNNKALALLDYMLAAGVYGMEVGSKQLPATKLAHGNHGGQVCSL